MTAYLVDTDVLIDSLRGAAPLRLPDGCDAACSVITHAELYAGRNVRAQPIEELLAALGEVDLVASIAVRAGEIRREHGLGLADAVIAASALETGRTVLTRNRRLFESVPDLPVRGPHELD